MRILEAYNFISIILPAVTAGTLSYLWGLRQKKQERFAKNLELSLESVLAPMYHSIRKINREKNAKKREELFADFFNTYSSSSSPIYNLFDGFILKYYYNTEEFYYTFLNIRTEEKWEEFYCNYSELVKMVENLYFTINGVRSVEYQWYKSLRSSNIIIKFSKEIIKGFYDISKGLLFLQFIFYYFYLMMKIFKQSYISFINPYLPTINIVTVINLILVAILMMVNEYEIIRNTNSPKSKFNLYLRRNFPKYFEWWDKFLIIKNNKRNIYPKMYNKKNFD